jgi:methionyl-tRNA formyltransferase
MSISNINKKEFKKKHTKKILFLGYRRSQTRIVDHLINRGCCVEHTSDPIKECDDYDFVVSFGYKHIISKEIINKLGCPIFNLHISLLPLNRGAHPNFWSFYDNTQAGVTIHLVDEGIDTGPIVFQKRVLFSEDEDTFSKTYKRLIYEIETLFEENLEKLLQNQWTSSPQSGSGTFHKQIDLPKNFAGWNSQIKKEIDRLKKEKIE